MMTTIPTDITSANTGLRDNERPARPKSRAKSISQRTKDWLTPRSYLRWLIGKHAQAPVLRDLRENPDQYSVDADGYPTTDEFIAELYCSRVKFTFERSDGARLNDKCAGAWARMTDDSGFDENLFYDFEKNTVTFW